MLGMAATLLLSQAAQAEPLKIAYSDWMGYVPWDIAARKGFFEKRGVDVELKWFEYMPAMDAFAAGQVDGLSVAASDAMVLTATGTRNIMIMIHDYGNGNDQIVAKPGINSIKDLKGKKVSVEIGVISHIFLLKALELNGMTEADVTLVNTPNAQAPQVFASDGIAAASCWQPASGQAMAAVAGSTVIASSAEIHGIVFDGLFVSPQTLRARRDDWQKVVNAWYDVMEFMADPANEDEVLQILADRISMTPEQYRPLLPGTHLCNKEDSLKLLDKTNPTGIYAAQKMADEFFMKNNVYTESVNFERGIDESFMRNAK
jgi:NitT/TauT family transport system substrate-binding protein